MRSQRMLICPRPVALGAAAAFALLASLLPRLASAQLLAGEPAVSQPGEMERLLLGVADPRTLLDIPGLHLRSCRNGLCTADAWLDDLDIARLRNTAVAVERSGTRRPMLDRSLPAAGVTDELRAEGLTGRGVLVVVIDSGIDWRHPDFAGDEERSSRIELLIDLSSPPSGHHPTLEALIDAAVWDRADIEAHLAAEAAEERPIIEVEERDTFGHGTHVASVAAGRRGVAPEASLLVVRAAREAWPATFDDADVLEATRLAFDLAEELEMPAVVALALGGHQGPHDGTSLLEQGLADLVGPEHPGRAIVVAAGNSGGCQDHARGDPQGGSVDLVLEVTGEDASLAIDVELWSPPWSDLAISLTTPDGEHVGSVGRGEERTDATDAAWVSLANAPDGPDERNDDLLTMISLRPQLAGPIMPGQYLVTASGRGPFDAYLSWASSDQLTGAARLLTLIDPDGTLTVPGTSPEMIVVGASVSRRGWTDITGRTWLDDRYELGGVAPYSGSGPTRSGELKPDIVAPGHAVIAAMSRDAAAGNEGSLFTPSSSFTPERYLVVNPGDRAVLWGTSIAAPHAAGVVALLLQLDPTLTQGDLRTVLMATARTSGGAAGRAWSPRWGFGELDAAAAVRLVREGFGHGVSASESSLGTTHDVLAPDECTTVTVVPKDADGFPLGPGLVVEIEASAGPTSETLDDGDGLYRSRYCTGSAPLGSLVIITATVEGVVLDRGAEVLIATDRGHIGAWATAAGGCRSGHREWSCTARWLRLLDL